MVPLPPLRPHRYFRRHGESLPLPPALGAVALTTVVALLAGAGIGLALVDAVDPAVTVENPDKPAEWACETASGDTDMPTPSGCTEPDEVPARDVLWDAFSERLGSLALAVPLGWLVGSVVVHALSWLANGRGSFGTTLAVVAWSTVPTAVQSVAAYLAFRFLLGDRTVGDIERLADVVQSVADHPLVLAVSVIGVLWSGAILYAGLRESRAHDAPAAAAITGLLVLVGLVAAV